jgi:S-type Pyocin.
MSVSHGRQGYWGYRLISGDDKNNYYLKIFVPYGDSEAAKFAKASQDLLDAVQAEEAAKKAAEAASSEDKAAAEEAAAAAEQARENAELEQQKQQRLAAQARLFSQDIQAVRGIAVTSGIEASPVSFALAGLGGISYTGTPAAVIHSRLMAAFAWLYRIATASIVGPVTAVVTALFYTPSVGVGSDLVPGRDVSAMIPGDTMGLPDVSELEKAYETGTPVAMPVRGSLDMDEENKLSLNLVRSPVTGSVNVAKAVKDEQTGYYSYALPDIPGVPRQTILISPADAPGVNGPTALTGPVALPELVVSTGDYDGDGTVPTNDVLPTPWPLDNDFNDIILIFPPDSGLRPIYVMFRSPRNMPGTVGGKGKSVGDNWLGGASEGEGAPIPKQVADKLRGKTYSSFDSFRRALWKAVGADPDLSKQFNSYDIEVLKKGHAPLALFKDAAGKRIKMELHHKTEISKWRRCL